MPRPHGIVIVLIGQRACSFHIASGKYVLRLCQFLFFPPKRRFSFIKGVLHLILLPPVFPLFRQYLNPFPRKY